MRSAAAATYLLASLIWDLAVFGTCTYLVFWRDHSGWWYLLAILLCANSTSNNAAKIAGTWKPEMERKDD